MTSRKIHLDLYDVSGPSWTALSPEDINRLERIVRELPILGKDPEQYAITGITRVDNVIAGYFVTQFEHEVLEYDQKKIGKRFNRPEWGKTVFALFPQIGKLLLQSQQYPKGLTKDMVLEVFKNTISDVVRRAKLSNTTLVTPVAPQEISDQQFVETFENPKNKVEKLIVDDLHPNPTLEELTYYNPQRDRNMVVGLSLNHDFGILKRLLMETDEKKPDLRSVHIAKAAVRSGKNEEMQYTAESGQKHTLRRRVRDNYEILVDMDVEPIREEDVRKMAEQVLEQFGLYRQPKIPDSLPDQSTLFDLLGDQE